VLVSTFIFFILSSFFFFFLIFFSSKNENKADINLKNFFLRKKKPKEKGGRNREREDIVEGRKG
jgi:hypothetical protein